jgi:hypothetical protein
MSGGAEDLRLTPPLLHPVSRTHKPAAATASPLGRLAFLTMRSSMVANDAPPSASGTVVIRRFCDGAILRGTIGRAHRDTPFIFRDGRQIAGRWTPTPSTDAIHPPLTAASLHNADLNGSSRKTTRAVSPVGKQPLSGPAAYDALGAWIRSRPEAAHVSIPRTQRPTGPVPKVRTQLPPPSPSLPHAAIVARVRSPLRGRVEFRPAGLHW